MTAINPQRRSQTARELAKRFGKSPRTIYRVMAEPREEYEARAAQRHEKIRALRAQGLTYREISETVDCSIGTVHNALAK